MTVHSRAVCSTGSAKLNNMSVITTASYVLKVLILLPTFTPGDPRSFYVFHFGICRMPYSCIYGICSFHWPRFTLTTFCVFSRIEFLFNQHKCFSLTQTSPFFSSTVTKVFHSIIVQITFCFSLLTDMRKVFYCCCLLYCYCSRKAL